MPKLYIAIYQPKEGNYKHWALYLEAAPDHIIFEVTGSHSNFRRNVLKGKPGSSSRHRRSILVGTIRDQDVKELITYMEKVNVDNGTVHWNCQDYVIEAIDGLYEECIIDEDDKDFEKGKKLAVENYYGAQ